MGVRQNEHVVTVGFGGPPSRQIGAEWRKGLGEGRARIEVPAGHLVLRRNIVIEIHADLVFAVTRGYGVSQLSGSIRRTWNRITPIGKFKIQEREGYGINI